MSCSVESASSREALGGSAAYAPHLLCLEHGGPWPSDPFQAPMSPELQQWLGALHGHPEWRVQLIRRPQTPPDTSSLLVADATKGTLFRYELPDPTVLLQASTDELLLGHSLDGIGSVHWQEPTILVCTHGKRDVCCASHGTKLFSQLDRIAPGMIWQTSHLGGHRFAPTLLALPFGWCYGRFSLREDELAQWLEQTCQGNLTELELLRGNVTRKPHQQVAEIEFRKQFQMTKIDHILLLETTQLANDRWQVTFESNSDTNTVEVSHVMSDALRAASCNDKPTPFFKWSATL